MSENNLEQNLKDCISKEIENGIIEKTITKNLEKCINDSINGLFGYSGVITKTIEKQIESVIIPYLEQYDFSSYLVALDAAMTDILNNCTLDNRTIMNNFKEYVSPLESETITLSEIWDVWCTQCSIKIDNDNVSNLDCDGGLIYCSFKVTDTKNYLYFSDCKTVKFMCADDESLNVEFELIKSNRRDNGYDIDSPLTRAPIRSLRYANDLEILLMKLSTKHHPVIIDKKADSKEVFVEFRNE